MKDISLGNLIIRKMKIVMLLTILTFLILGCNGTNLDKELKPHSQSAVVIGIKDIVFDGMEELKTKASDARSRPVIYERTLPLNENFDLVAELSIEEIKTTNSNTKPSLKNNNSSDIKPVDPNIKYKVAVFNEDGIYVIEKDYIRGQESSAGDLMLDGGKKYIFIVYSVNSTSTLPSITFSNPSNKTLATSSVSFNGTADLMYYKKEMVLSGENRNYLDVVLKHKLSQITTTIDASATAYNVTAATSQITNHYNTGNISLGDGSITRTGSLGNTTVSFPSLNSEIVTSSPTIINANGNNNTSYRISALTIGPLTVNNITPFTDLVVTPGVKYNMKLKIVPEDAFLTINGISVAKINGQVWMRHNLGATYSANADQNPSVSALQGNYYQWGRNTVVATVSTSASAISGWDGNASQPLNMWNIGTEAAPKKSGTDPCPAGFRIPTHTEQNALVQATTQSDIGTSNSSPTNYSAAKVFTSKRNGNIKLTFPLAGNRKFDTGELVSRGSNGFYWSSTPVATNNSRRHHYGLSFGAPPNEGMSVPSWAFPVRCIKE